MTEMISALLAICDGESTVDRWITLRKGPDMWGLEHIVEQTTNCWWFGTPLPLCDNFRSVVGCILFLIIMMTSSNGTFSVLLALCEGNPPVTGRFPPQSPVTRSFDIFFDPRLNKRLSKQSRHRCFEMPSRTLWRHYNDTREPSGKVIS